MWRTPGHEPGDGHPPRLAHGLLPPSAMLLTRALPLLLTACTSSPALPPAGSGGGGPDVDLGDPARDAGPADDGGADEPPDRDGGGGDGGGDGGPAPGPSIAPGGACACDDDCIGDAEHAGLCIHGICGTRATAAQCEAGSRAECPAGQRCWSGTGNGVCYPDFVEGQCAGQRDGDGSCVAAAGQECFASCGALCDLPGEPEDGGDCPPWPCDGAGCDEIVPVPGSTDPASADAAQRGYYLESSPEYRFLRRDALMILQWATCEMAARHPGAPPLAFLDLTTEDGTTPGCENGPDGCRHPGGTHQGTDADTAYYQTDGDNDGEIVCGDGTDDNANGQPGRFNDGYFCTTEDNVVDVALEIELIELLDSTSRLRVIGVDETLADDLAPSGAVLGYGSEGGWAYHHHHTHASFTR